LRRSTIGAHVASSNSAPARSLRADRQRPRRRLLGLALATAAIGSLAIAPAAGATTAGPRLATQTAVALTTTTIDKPWYTVERFYLGLVNCTRTGGWVLSDGTCRGYGSGHYSRYVTPLTYSYGLSDKVSRPYAKLLATRSLCSHYADRDPGYRLRRSGYYRYTWGENIGCGTGYSSAKAAVLASHRRMQAERSTNGGHWLNIKNTRFKTTGVGIWNSGAQTRVVTDFYG
jgi:hypothetical protein